jgi:hypothetical protein
MAVCYAAPSGIDWQGERHDPSALTTDAESTVANRTLKMDDRFADAIRKRSVWNITQ